MSPPSLTPADLRALVPAVERRTWLNAAASSPLPRPVYEAMERFASEAMLEGDVRWPAWVAQKDALRSRLAAFVGATADELAFTPSTSFGFHLIAQFLGQHGVTEVLTLEPEFPSTTVPLLHAGLTLRGVRMRPDGTVSVDQLEQALRPTTGAIAVSAVQFSSGFRIDLAAVGALCRARGLVFIVNAAQGLGHVPLDVSGLGIDFLAATSHKWFMAGHGTGVLVVRKRWLEGSRLPLAGWLSVPQTALFETWAGSTRVEDSVGFVATGSQVRAEAAALETGGLSWVGLHAMEAALTLHERLGPSTVLAHNIALQLELREALRRRSFRPTTPDDPGTLSGICVVPVRGAPADVVRALLHEGNVATTPRGGGVRLSTHVFNDQSDLERLVHALARLGIAPA